MKKLSLWLPLAAILFLSSCGEEIARLPINKISTEEDIHEESVTLDLMAEDEVALWSEMDMKYDGDANMVFYVTVLLEGEELEELQFDPREKNISMKEVQTDINGKVNWSFSGKNGTFSIPEDGAYTFKGVFFATPNVSIEKAEIVIKK